MIYAMSDIHGCINELKTNMQFVDLSGTDRQEELIKWIEEMPSYYDGESQIFVHAGIDEEAGEYWMWGSYFFWHVTAISIIRLRTGRRKRVLKVEYSKGAYNDSV